MPSRNLKSDSSRPPSLGAAVINVRQHSYFTCTATHWHEKSCSTKLSGTDDFRDADFEGTIVENGTKLLVGQTRCLISTKRLSRIAEDQREEAIPGHSVQLRLCRHEFAELLVGIRHPSRSPIERSLFCHVTAVRTAPCRSSDRKTWYDFGAAVHEPNRSQHFTNGFGRNIPLLV